MPKTLDHANRYFEFEDGHKLTIKAMRPPKFVLVVYGIISFGLLCGPLIGQVFWIASGGRLSFAFFLAYSFTAVVGYFTLRTLLWNAFGKEIFYFSNSEVRHQADFRFFKNQMQRQVIGHDLHFTKQFVGYEEDRNFVLIIKGNDWELTGSAKIPEHEIDEIIWLLKKKYV